MIGQDKFASPQEWGHWLSKQIEKEVNMAFGDLSGKTVYELKAEEFDMLFCRRCRKKPECDRSASAMSACQLLIDDGVWYDTHQSRLQPAPR